MDDDTFVWIVWTPSKDGYFTINSLSLELAKTSPASHSQLISRGKLWKGIIPPRIEVFTWLALLGKINTKLKLARMNIIPPDETTCILCQDPRECVDHLLFTAPLQEI